MSDFVKHPMRSWLFTPATRPDRFASAAASGTDIAILDLEDSVAPPDKESARQNAVSFITSRQSDKLPLALRINGLDTPAGIEDLCMLFDCGAQPDYLILPKTESASHLQILDRLLTAAGAKTSLIGLIESLRGLNVVETIAGATPRLAGLMFGAADMAADIGASISWEPLLQTRCRIINACAACGIAAIDAPFFDIHDQDALEAEALKAAVYGFTAKASIHPAQISVINTLFTPTEAEITRARSILAENAKGVGTLNGMMIDEAVARQARRTLARAGLSA
ncbi:itaconate degradation C-C-lyase RipC [Pantoea cypripedii]|uniref:CoA ester lyase n=1 Tax=Pantoea cypripedii TaxID=55209 RepID=A0A6B9G4M3_PANCY|nr:itaconate degradation C-C-lyase RipC [Pantoea cypripedii]QGY32464.1 CoA ester lyase [Pantoea cypripedii]